MNVELPLALKYRPKKLSQVVGQPVVVKAFTNAFKMNNLHHAYILAGYTGCGKTTVARIVAAMENCSEGGFDPCGKCDNCKEIFTGKSYEVLELDAGSKGNVDDIRALHQSLYTCPVECKTKYVIIDEAHSLSGKAAEAALKMIEEPPPMVRFILCIDENQKVYTKNGRFVRIKDVKKGDEILTEEGFSRIKNKFHKGIDKVYDLRTKGGAVLRLTGSHRIRIFDGNSIIWKKVRDIVNTDHIPIFHSYKINSEKDISSDCTLDECEFLGRMVGDGYYTYKRLGILFNEKELDYGKTLLNKLGYTYKEYNKGKCSDIKIYNKNSYIKKRFKLEGYKRGQKELPSIAYDFNIAQLEKFLAGWVGADGYIDKKGYKRLYSNNLLLISQLKMILASHGYYVSLSQSDREYLEDSKTTGIKKGKYTSYTMLFLKKEPTIKISDSLRSNLIKKYDSCKILGKKTGHDKKYHLSKKMLNDIDDPNLQYLKKRCCFERFHSLTLVEESEVYDLEIDNKSHSFIVNGFSVHNCTTEPQAFKETIHGRCIMWTFNKVSRPVIFKHLQNISNKENLNCDDETLQVIAKNSKGSVRNSLQHLQKVMNYVGDEPMTYESAIEAIGVIDSSLYFNFFDGIIAKDAVKCFTTINDMFRDGKEAKIVLDGVYEHLNNLLVTRTCRKDLSSFDFTQEETKRYLHQNSTITKNGGDDILRMMNLLSTVSFGVSYSLNPAQLLNKFSVESIRMMMVRK